jgi:hypothetical protein
VPISHRLKIALKSLRELGTEQVGLYARYQMGLRSGLYRWMTPPQEPNENDTPLQFEIVSGLIQLPDQDNLAQVIGENASALLSEANDLGDGKVRLFGGSPQNLDLIVPLPLEHWTFFAIDETKVGAEDIKFIWEPARFGWAYTLARAYHLSKNDEYVETFWREFDAFTDINLTNLGPNWVSAQEVALRLIALTFAYQVFSASPITTPIRKIRLSKSIADHADRIPPTLVYARAQNNNHLLTEASGLFTASECLPAHPRAQKWRKLGWHWFNHALQSQITDDGTYIQHSTNYHRLMLQVALWVKCLVGSLPEEINQRLAAATTWLLDLTDPKTGRVPNLGHNDGAYFQPLASSSFHDYRPVLQAASLAFLDELSFLNGHWDELALWLGLLSQAKNEILEMQRGTPTSVPFTIYPSSHVIMQDESNHSWASLRVASYHSRPAHADQLHLDLWWRGLNIAQDAGTFLYNSPPPWDNTLARTKVHNTVTIDEQDQMTRAGLFLWLDWAQAQIVEHTANQNGHFTSIVAQHDGYHSMGVVHQRAISLLTNGDWLIEDTLKSPHTGRTPDINKETLSDRYLHRLHQARLHWLMPDWSWNLQDQQDQYQCTLQLRSPHGWIDLNIGIEPATLDRGDVKPPVIQVARAGECLSGSGLISPDRGWVAPMYGSKLPAISLSVLLESFLPIKFKSQWHFPEKPE